MTHNIEEAVQMCDRLLIFSTNPGRVVSEIPVDLPQPRHTQDPRFRALIERVYVEMTARPRGELRAGPKAERFAGHRHRHRSDARLLQRADGLHRGGDRAALQRQG